MFGGIVILSFVFLSCSAIVKSRLEGADASAEDAAGDGLDSHGDSVSDSLEDGDSVPPDGVDVPDVETEGDAVCGNREIEAGEECDDGRNHDPDDGCRDDCTFSCHRSDECEGRFDCEEGKCDTETHACTLQPRPAGTPCREATGECDVTETCDGEAPHCPGNGYSGPDKTCRPASGICDIADVCSGAGPHCPLDAVAGDDVLCRESEGDCDAAELCDGENKACPADAVTAEGEICRPAATICDAAEACNGSDVACPNNFGGILKVATGGFHTCAIHDTRGVLCWGQNANGQLGTGDYAGSLVPRDISMVAVPGLYDIATGGYHTCRVLGAGPRYAQCWGENAFGQLGDGTFTSRTTPANVVVSSGGELLMGLADVSASGFYTCALMDSGGVKCWGNGLFGRLGNGSTDNSNVPVDVVGIASGATGVSAGASHACALLEDGTVKCWGLGASGQLGTGEYESSTTPVQVMASDSSPLDEVAAISAGNGSACALLESGAIMCWGYNEFGQLGAGLAAENSAYPVTVAGLTSVRAIDAGEFHACALLDTGVWCWGNNSAGQLGNAASENSNVPVHVSGSGPSVTAFATNFNHTCAILDSRQVWCWGLNDYGQLGDGTTIDRDIPVQINCPEP